jgi:DNA-directed RNA polymerase specialized sigma24 family protein
LYVKRQRKGRSCFTLVLYQGKNVREMAQEARMSLRDVGAILKKAEANISI